MVIATTSNKVLKITGHEVEVIDQDRGLYYGLAKTDKGFIVASRHHGCATILYHYWFNEEHNLECREKWEVPWVSDVHGIAFVNRRVYCADTSHNRVVSFDIDNGHAKREEWLGHHKHINTVEFYQNCFYIAGLGNNSLYRQHCNGEVLFDEGKQGDGLHTIKPYQGYMWICNSQECTVSRFSTSLKEKYNTFQIDDKEEFMSRGLAWDNGAMYCGLSPRAERSQRHELTSKIFVREDSKVSFINLQGEGQILDLLTL